MEEDAISRRNRRMKHRVYQALVKAIRDGELCEPFTVLDFQRSCPGFGNGTYNAFLHKHRLGNPGRESELFDRIAPGQFKCLRPFKYGL
jgi:hypothetical protein